MWCPNCGSEVPESASFCMNCGTDLRPFKSAMSTSGGGSTVTPIPLPDPAPTPQPAPAPQPAPQPAQHLATNEAMRRAQSFMALLDEKGYRYDYLHERDGDHRDGLVALSFGGGSFSFASIRVFVDFDYNNAGEGDSVHIWCSGIASFPDARRRAALEAINQVGIKKRFVRYYLDKDGDLMADADFWIGADSAAQRAFDHMTTFVSVIDDTYVDLQKARWN